MSRHRDDSIERLLSAVNGRADEGVSPDCLEAEALAAWMEDRLDPAARAKAEAHASGCARCQAMLAAMARTETASESLAVQAAPRWTLRQLLPWAVPLTLVVTVVGIWLAIRSAAVPSTPVPAEAPVAGQMERPVAVGEAKAPASTELRRDRETELAGESADRRRSIAPATPPSESALRMEKSTADLRDEKDNRRVSAPAPATIPAVAAAPPASATPQQNVAPQQNVGQQQNVTQQQVAARQQAARPQQADARRFAAPVPTRVPEKTPETRARSTPAGAIVAEALLEAPPVVIKSTDPKIQWRIVSNRVVQRSIDGGAIWSAQSVDIDNASPLLAGAAPSATVCWVVGRAGTVLRTTDGATWQRLAFPEPVDLTRVVATNAEVATVTTVDGRSFATKDGGKTWSPLVP